jgi:hypothetical protein
LGHVLAKKGCNANGARWAIVQNLERHERAGERNVSIERWVGAHAGVAALLRYAARSFAGRSTLLGPRCLTLATATHRTPAHLTV